MVERRLRRWKIQRQVIVEWPLAAILLAKLGVVWGLRPGNRKASRVQYRHTNQPCNIFNGASHKTCGHCTGIITWHHRPWLMAPQQNSTRQARLIQICV